MEPCRVCLDKVEFWQPTVERLQALPPGHRQRQVLRRTIEAIDYWKARSEQPHTHAVEDD